MNHYRIGIRYIDLSLFHQGYPYIWGDGSTRYLEDLRHIKAGDIIVAGGIERVSFIGEVLAPPAYLFATDEAIFADHDLQKADDTIIAAFEPLESSHHDVICIKAKWFDIDCSGLRMPTQAYGAINRLNPAGAAYIDNVLRSPYGKSKASDINPILNFTAIDFETACGYRNSVCQVGLVKVVNGVIIDEYCGLIQPPNNFIRQDFTGIHGIEPAQTAHAPSFADSYPRWRHFIEAQTLVAHNMQFDLGCLQACLQSFYGLEMEFNTYCTMLTWRGAFENAQLATCCRQLGIDLSHHHNALADARACAELFIAAVTSGRSLR
ncbi:MAG: 3'-5' exoribonuclease [Deferribacteraceae bacterium]|jgi:DNA polymerase-3 subunit epsilon|nr:3'-5' exoribonuclease [Deferribacteraceae bacterium]